VNTEDFVSKIRWATAPGMFDVSTDGFQPYETAIDAGLYDRANHAAVVKMFHTTTDVVPESYRPAKFVSVGKDVISGDPDRPRRYIARRAQERNTTPVVQAAHTTYICVLALMG
jgi:hypothetical protein